MKKAFEWTLLLLCLTFLTTGCGGGSKDPDPEQKKVVSQPKELGDASDFPDDEDDDDEEEEENNDDDDNEDEDGE